MNYEMSRTFAIDEISISKIQAFILLRGYISASSL